MKYIVVTEIDQISKIPCTVLPMVGGVSLPEIKGINLDWADMSTWPVEVAQDGKYLRPPKYYATCDDDANLDVAGVVEVLTEQEWMERKHDEFYARRPYNSWIWDSKTLTWASPIPYPENVNFNEYYWDENTISWVKETVMTET
jgi:hypothetical protein